MHLHQTQDQWIFGSHLREQNQLKKQVYLLRKHIKEKLLNQHVTWPKAVKEAERLQDPYNRFRIAKLVQKLDLRTTEMKKTAHNFVSPLLKQSLYHFGLRGIPLTN